MNKKFAMFFSAGRWTVAFALATVFLCGLSARAQTLYGSLTGLVEDQTGAVVPNASVKVLNKGTGATREALTNSSGTYTISNIQAGVYDVTVEASGFKSVQRTGVNATINSVTRLDVKLEVGATTDQVTVTSSAAELQTDSGDVHVQLSSKEVTDMPLGNYRNYQSLINLVPGATPAAFQNSVQGAPARGLATNINGTNKNNNLTKLDGAVNLYLWLPHHTAYVAPQETVETVNVATNNFDAEQGMAGGASITVVTKSGTNEFHGSLFGYHTNNKLKAKNFFFSGDKLPNANRNMDGGTFGGPIIKNKLFFFGGWEGLRERSSSATLYTVATPAIREGDFSAFNTAIYDPNTGNANGTGRTLFPGGIVPLNRQSEISRKMQSLVPLPTLPGTASNFYNNGTQAFNRDNYDVKMNWNRSAAHSVFVKYSAMNASASCPFALGPAGGGAVCAGSAAGTSHTLTQISTIGHTWTLSPTIVVDGTVGWTRLTQQATNPDYGTNAGLEFLGIPGTNGPDPRQSGLPAFTISGGFTQLGNGDNPRPNTYADQSYTASNNIGINKGKHDLRFGFDLVRHQLNHWQPELNNPRGVFTFSGAETALSGGAAPNQYNAYAAFLLGTPSSMGKSLQYLTMSGREWQFGWYARDRWQVSQRLTLSLGLRYEYYPLMTRADRGIERWDPATNLVLFGGRGNNDDNVGITVSKKLFAPRIGAAYKLGNSTVFRAGYGITYDPLPFSRPLRGPYPATISQTFVGASSFAPAGTLEKGIPFFTGPDIDLGSAPLPPTVDIRMPYAGQIKRGYIQSWNAILEHRLPGDFVATMGYVGTRTIHQLAEFDVNAAPVGGGNTGRPFFPIFGRTATTALWSGYLSSHYHGLQTSISRAMRNGLLLRGAYTYSKTINATDEDGAASVMWNHPSVFYRNYAAAGYDRRHVLQMAAVYEMPFGPGKRWATSGFTSALVRNWQINGTFSAYTGAPFTVTASGASLNAPGNAQTADQVKPTVEKLGGIGAREKFYDPTAFAPVSGVRYGNTGRNILRAPGLINTDLTVFRSFPIKERIVMQFRAEAFNATNTPHFDAPNANASGTNFLSITSAQADERVFRFALRLQF